MYPVVRLGHILSTNEHTPAKPGIAGFLCEAHPDATKAHDRRATNQVTRPFQHWGLGPDAILDSHLTKHR